MDIRELPDLTPVQVVELVDALLANADTLLTTALTVLEQGQVPLARSLVILGMEESGKAIAVHERRVQMAKAPNGEPFRCEALDRLWGSHRRKLEKVHDFLVEELYWFDTEPSDPTANAAYLGTIRTWTKKQDRLKMRGFYVELSKTGEVMAPTDVSDEATLFEVISHVHQIGWQLRLGEHIEGKRQDEQEAGTPPVTDEDMGLFDRTLDVADDPELTRIMREVEEQMRRGTPGVPLNNAAYRFDPPGADRSPFSNLGKPGYEAETRELIRLRESLERDQGPRSD
ncbi:AbiV family abortive infection protein [Nocardioides alpinus]|uniref:AbiV family abortive infection protein n=1 Tax=Nocardioides alpinus TaxID=748909 RepID=A0ABX4QZ10_9ACTN|nr:AbiV family abortive infection protein [Nocardioides alpinus]PKH42158.1 AbiV family abortive infection protein [Nocardioides alpinus]